MKAKVYDFNNKEVGTVDLKQEVFGLTPSETVLNSVVNWQRARKQAGTHQTKTISDVSGTGRKPHKQKGTGNARLGTLRANQCRGGGIVFGPQTRDHSHDLPKKVRKLGVKMALSSKFADGKLKLIDSLNIEKISTKEVKSKLSSFYTNSLLIIDVENNTNNENFVKSVHNIMNVNILLQIGANVYDLLRHENVLITKEAVKTLEERLV